MKILSPVDRMEEVEPLLKAGADELYGGFVPPEWQKKYSLLGSINKRTFASAQFEEESELKQAVERAHELGGRFFLTLNNDYYSADQYPLVLKEVERAVELGIDALLVADLGLILAVKEHGYPIELNLSILTAVLNSEAARFYRGLGVRRVVLDRTLTTSEVARITKNVPELEFEVFIAYGKCPNIEGLCTLFHHDDPEHRWPCGYLGWEKVNRGAACGLCGMFDLAEAGIHSLKIAGRGRDTSHKLRAVEAVAKMREVLETGIIRDDFYELARDKYRELFGGECGPYVCYCPALRQAARVSSEE